MKLSNFVLSSGVKIFILTTQSSFSYDIQKLQYIIDFFVCTTSTKEMYDLIV